MNWGGPIKVDGAKIPKKEKGEKENSLILINNSRT
jgi:hypothetical protein